MTVAVGGVQSNSAAAGAVGEDGVGAGDELPDGQLVVDELGEGLLDGVPDVLTASSGGTGAHPERARPSKHTPSVLRCRDAICITRSL